MSTSKIRNKARKSETAKDVKKSNNNQNDDDLYNVEKILDKKVQNGEIRYLIKWDKWPKSQATWEPLENLTNVKEMLDEFDKKISEKEEKDNSKATQEEKLSESKLPKSTKKQVNAAKSQEKSPVKQPLSKKQSKSPGLISKFMTIADEVPQTSPSKKPKMNPVIDDKNMLDPLIEQPMHGHFKFGDKPRRIISAKSQEPYVVCLIEWEPRPDGVIPLRTNLTNKEIKQYDPLFLIEFYETKLRFSTGPANPDQAKIKPNNEVGQNTLVERINKGGNSETGKNDREVMTKNNSMSDLDRKSGNSNQFTEVEHQNQELQKGQVKEKEFIRGDIEKN